MNGGRSHLHLANHMMPNMPTRLTEDLMYELYLFLLVSSLYSFQTAHMGVMAAPCTTCASNVQSISSVVMTADYSVH